MKKHALGVVMVLSLALSIPLSNVNAGFIDDVSSWVQTSFFGPKIFGGFGKSKKDYVPEEKIVPTRTKTVKSLRDTADHPVMRTYTAPQRTYSAPMTTKSSTSGVAVAISCNGGLCCEDSDGGIIPEKKGRTTLRHELVGVLKSFSDETVNDGVLEYYCQEGAQLGVSYMECANGVGNGVCEEGTQVAPCTDSDGGKFIYEKGTVVANGVSKTDGCVTSELLAEWFCDGDYADNDVMECDNGCNNGACIQGDVDTEGSGTLTAEIGTTVYSDILLAGQTDREIMKIRFRAGEADVEVHSFDLSNIGGTNLIGGQVVLSVYDEAGRLIVEQAPFQEGQYFRFSFSSSNRIRIPANGTTQVTIKADVKDISEAHQSGVKLKLHFAGLSGTGFEARNAQYDAESEDFVLYKSELSVKHAAVQPNFQDPSMMHQEMYRFTVTADSSNSVELGKLTFDVNLQGMAGIRTYLTKEDFKVLQVKQDGTLDETANVAMISRVSNSSNTSNASKNSARVNVDFINQKFDQRETRTYALLVGYLENSGQMANEDDSVAVSIVRDEDFFASGDRNTVWGWNDIIWSDEASSSHSDTTKDWHNGYLIDIDSAAQVNSDSSGGGNTGGSSTPQSSLSINHSSTQPNLQDPSIAQQEVYRFTVKADSKGSVQLGKMSLDVNLQGMKKSSGNLNRNDFRVLQVKSDGTIDETGMVANISPISNASATSARVGIDFVMQNLNAGESRTYTLLIGNLENNGFVADDDAVAVTLRNDTQAAGPAKRAYIGTSYIIWSDRSASDHSDTTADWYNGYSLDVYEPAQVNSDSAIVVEQLPDLYIQNVFYIEAYGKEEPRGAIAVQVCNGSDVDTLGNNEIVEMAFWINGARYTGNALRVSGYSFKAQMCENLHIMRSDLSFPDISTGIYPVKVEVDFTKKIAESDEGNNVYTKSLVVEIPVESTCSDSDNGLNYYTKGSTRMSGTNMLPLLDSCSGKMTLSERYCTSATAMGQKEYNCEFGCSDGACNTKPDIIKPGAPVDLAGNKIWHLSWSNQWVYAKGYCQIVKGKTTYASFKTAKTSDKVCRCDSAFGCKGESCTSNQEYYTEIVCKDETEEIEHNLPPREFEPIR